MSLVETDLKSRYGEIKARLRSLKPPAKVIPINVVPFESPVTVIVAPHVEPPPPEPSPPELTVVPRPVPWLSEINEVVRKFYKIGAMDFVSARRTNDIVFARHVAMYLAKELTARSYPSIGRQMGWRDHTTVMHGCRRIQAMLLSDARLNDELDLLVIKINERMAQRQAIGEQP